MVWICVWKLVHVMHYYLALLLHFVFALSSSRNVLCTITPVLGVSSCICFMLQPGRVSMYLHMSLKCPFDKHPFAALTHLWFLCLSCGHGILYSFWKMNYFSVYKLDSCVLMKSWKIEIIFSLPKMCALLSSM